MVELVVSDLYDQIANTQTRVRIRPEAVYECRYCPMYRISGSVLRDSYKGRAHAAAHRIAFEALLEPSPVLICPICDQPQKTSDTACIFGCMFNDLDLVENLEQDHVDILTDDMVCDFSDPRYLLTTFREIQLPRTMSESSDEASDVIDSDADDGTTTDPSDGDNDVELDTDVDEPHRKSLATEDSVMKEVSGDVSHEFTRNRPLRRNCVAKIEPKEEPLSNDELSGDEASVAHGNQVVAITNSKRTSRKKRCGKVLPRKHMPGVSVITCLVCQWTPSVVSDSKRMRDEISTHVRFHIRKESKRFPNKSSSFFRCKFLNSV
ncbi:hypothetical protein KIN20_002230 [Parelaphostrongylus tenuis]|uniref:Uncharacterized protein n=1 Tax=Parelaphostrongylus tenuis TaxID=148309 RepID=A0AAD5MGH5_PARTN|nr:hypothetical protein KIN20_002230 [Parelaphostrongylus tenuis]